MTDPTAMSSLGDLTKPATVLIEKISDAVGALYAPFQIVRVAKAEAEAALIRAESETQITDIQRRAIHRLIEEEGKKQENIEHVTRLALPQVEPSATPNAIENDWMTNFFDKCRLTSDHDLQMLWSRVLAGEANVPGSFSRRTVNFLAALDKTDAEQFTSLCSFGWSILRGRDLTPLIFDPSIDVYTSGNVRFSTLNHLESIGLIQFERLAGFTKVGVPKHVPLSYFGRTVELTLSQQADNTLDTGHVLLTQMGLELAPICGAEPNDRFFEYVVEKWKREGYLPSSPTSGNEGSAG